VSTIDAVVMSSAMSTNASDTSRPPMEADFTNHGGAPGTDAGTETENRYESGRTPVTMN
jgi:hypothetical protein